ncbi:MAG: hypothetical protein ACTHJJ_17095, partial [Intrasporangium sp.]
MGLPVVSFRDRPPPRRRAPPRRSFPCRNPKQGYAAQLAQLDGIPPMWLTSAPVLTPTQGLVSSGLRASLAGARSGPHPVVDETAL